MTWLDDNSLDQTARSPGAKDRPNRSGTKFLVVHRIRYGAKGDPTTWVDQIIDFFVRDAEGIAVTQIGGTYQSKVPTIARWRRDGVPAENLARAFVAYHLVVDRDGTPHRTLPLDVRGAHANPNSLALGIAFVGDFREPHELATWEKRAGGYGLDDLTAAQLRTMRFALRDLLVRYPGADIVTHDDTLQRRGMDPKGCPGARATRAVRESRRWAELAAGTMRARRE